ncbi:hypothetical protein JX266_013013 [Neoarthrinium moseri]|nr:hypothetical protein JX266_013013 [Neoarthrinium moseri]
MDRQKLEANRIYFFEDVGRFDCLHTHADALRSVLLDFDCTISDRLGFYEFEDFEDRTRLHSLLAELHAEEPERKRIIDAIHDYNWRTRRALALRHGWDREAEWEAFFDDTFFARLLGDMQITDEDRRSAKKRHWTLFSASGEFRQEHGQQGLTEPHPDWVAYFHIYNFPPTSGRLSNKPAGWRWDNWPRERNVENFSRATLQKLASNGLRSSVTDAFRDKRRDAIVASDCICYPWFVVEHQKQGSGKAMECYCQAANAAVAVLMMFRNLVKYSTHKEVQPVTVMTTVRSEVRIWTAFYDDSEDKYSMVCIWVGDMTKIIHLIELEAILENLHTWAMRVLQPWISQHIDSWRLCSQLKSSALPDDVEIRELGGVVLANSQADDTVAEENAKAGDKAHEDSTDNMASLLMAQNKTLLDQIEALVGKMSHSAAKVQVRSVATQTDFSVDMAKAVPIEEARATPDQQHVQEIQNPTSTNAGSDVGQFQPGKNLLERLTGNLGSDQSSTTLGSEGDFSDTDITSSPTMSGSPSIVSLPPTERYRFEKPLINRVKPCNNHIASKTQFPSLVSDEVFIFSSAPGLSIRNTLAATGVEQKQQGATVTSGEACPKYGVGQDKLLPPSLRTDKIIGFPKLSINQFHGLGEGSTTFRLAESYQGEESHASQPIRGQNVFSETPHYINPRKNPDDDRRVSPRSRKKVPWLSKPGRVILVKLPKPATTYMSEESDQLIGNVRWGSLAHAIAIPESPIDTSTSLFLGTSLRAQSKLSGTRRGFPFISCDYQSLFNAYAEDGMYWLVRSYDDPNSPKGWVWRQDCAMLLDGPA